MSLQQIFIVIKLFKEFQMLHKGTHFKLKKKYKSKHIFNEWFKFLRKLFGKIASICVK